MNLRLMDLNLLLVLDAVAAERSVTKAAAKLNMTQPAISQALGRLRSVLGDELFSRTPTGMEPTPYCRKLAGPVRDALEGLQTALHAAAPFDPLRSMQTFTLALDNRSAVMLGAPLALWLAERAPGVMLNLIPSGTLDIPQRLDGDEIDLAIGSLKSQAERFDSLHLFDDPFVALMRDGHPALRDGTLTLEGLAAAPHLELSSTLEETAFLDDVLARHGLQRRIALRAPMLAAGLALIGSDMIAIVSARGARAFDASRLLRVAELPFDTPRIHTMMVWHRKHMHVPAHRWLRQAVTSFVAGSERVRTSAAQARDGSDLAPSP